MATDTGRSGVSNANKTVMKRDRPGADTVTPPSQPLAPKRMAWSHLTGLELGRFAIERTLAHWRRENIDGSKRTNSGFAESARNQVDLEALLRAALADSLFAPDPYLALSTAEQATTPPESRPEAEAVAA